MEVCLNPGVLKVIYFIKLLMNIIFIIVPIGLIVMGSIDLSKSVANSDDKEQKKNLNLFLKRLLFSIILFAIPWIVNVFMSLLGSLSDGVNFVDCFINANPTNIKKVENEYDKGNNKNLEEIIENHKKDTANNSTKNGAQSGNKSSKNSNSNSDNNESSNNTLSNNIIYIGDSRTVHIFRNVFANASGDGCDLEDAYGGYYRGCKFNEKEIGYAKTGEGYVWLKSKEVSESLENMLSKYPDSYVGIYLGVNDCKDSGYANYVSWYENFVNKYKNAKLVVISVTEVDDAKLESNKQSIVRNADVDAFNSKIKNGVNTIKSNNSSANIYYCDLESKIKGNVRLSDGLHYESDSSKFIYNKMQDCFK